MADTRKKVAQASSDQEKREALEKRKALDKKKMDNSLNLLKNLGDIINSSTGAQIPAQLGFKFPETANALGGALSSSIAMYQVWPVAKK